MKLIPEQIYKLREEQRRLAEKIAEYNTYFQSLKVQEADETFASQVGDSITNDNFRSDRKKYEEIGYYLQHSDYVTTINTDKIDIGTKFVVKFDSEEEDEQLTLLEEAIGIHTLGNVVSINSVFGKEVLGKKANTPFSYTVNTGKTTNTITGMIKTIETDPTEYMHFIKSRPHNMRISSKEKEKIKQLLAAGDTESYAKRQELTESQVDLLKLEYQYLANRKPTDSIKNRLGIINRLLKNAKIASLPTDDTVGIGTNFSILLLGEEKTESIRVEMINRAVSTEIDKEYIERISSMGSKIFGLKNGEEFCVRTKNNKYITGIIFDIDNKKEQLKTNNASTYQASKVYKKIQH